MKIDSIIVTMRNHITIILLIGILISLINDYQFYLRVIKLKRAPIWIPFIGGILTSIGLFLQPVHFLKWLYWLPFILDYGCIPGIWESFVYKSTIKFWKDELYEEDSQSQSMVQKSEKY